MIHACGADDPAADTRMTSPSPTRFFLIKVHTEEVYGSLSYRTQIVRVSDPVVCCNAYLISARGLQDGDLIYVAQYTESDDRRVLPMGHHLGIRIPMFKEQV